MMPQERSLNRALRALAEAEPREAPAYLEQRLLAAFRARRRRRSLERWGIGAAAVAIAACLALVMLLAPHLPGRAPSASPAVAASLPLETAEFVPLPDADMDLPLEEATVVRVELPLSALAAIGMPVTDARSGERIEADILLGQDGLARGVRFVQ
jgi:hypothetical protein